MTQSTYNVYMLGTKLETRTQKNDTVVKETAREIINRRKNAERNARFVRIITR